MGPIFFQISDDITLSEAQISDGAAVFQAIDTNRKDLYQWLPFVNSVLEVDDGIKFIDYSRQAGDLLLVIRYKKEFAGLLGLKDVDRVNKKAEIGYWLLQSFRKKGIILRSVMRLTNYAFEEIGLNRIQIKVAVNNIDSRKIPEKLGFVKEGVERDGELLHDGYADLNIYSMLKSDEVWREWNLS